MSNINITGNVRIENGDIVGTYKNHLVGNGLISLLSCIISGHIYNSYSSNTCVGIYCNLPSNSWTMNIGNDTVTQTAIDTNDIVSSFNVAPSSKQIFTKSGASDGIWEVTYRGCWNRNTVAGNVGEIGLYTRCFDKTNLKWNISGKWSGTQIVYNPPVKMISRLSVADGDFEIHEIDTDYPLIIDWTIRFAFAGSGQS